MLSYVNTLGPTCFDSTIKLAKLSKVGKEPRCEQMRNAINEIAFESSKFVHHLVPNSPTAVQRLKNELLGVSVSDQCLVDWNTVINGMRVNMATIFKQNIADFGWENRHFAVVNSHSVYAIDIIKTKTGNCAEQALLAGILTKATLQTGLKLRGFSEAEITKADIQLTIGEFREQQSVSNDHTVCLLSYDINGEELFFVDPWINGAVFNQKNADEFYAAHIDNLQKPLIPTKVHLDKTMAINDAYCLPKVMESIDEHYEIDWRSLHPFKKYV